MLIVSFALCQCDKFATSTRTKPITPAPDTSHDHKKSELKHLTFPQPIAKQIHSFITTYYLNSTTKTKSCNSHPKPPTHLTRTGQLHPDLIRESPPTYG